MDLNVWITASLGIVGTLLGVIIGAWLNPLMQEWREKRLLKKFINECDELEQFIIFRAYKTTFLYMSILRLIDIELKKEPNNYVLSDCLLFFIRIREIIYTLSEENIILAKKDDEEYTISLRSNAKFFVNDNPKIKDKLIQATKKVIANEFFRYYKAILNEISSKTFDTDKKELLTKFIIFMNEIDVFKCYKQDLSHFDVNNLQSYLNFPQGEFHPEFKDN